MRLPVCAFAPTVVMTTAASGGSCVVTAFASPALVTAVRSMGSVQIRNVATLGGNLCNASPAADSAPPLLALGARARIQGGDGEREMPIEDLFAGPGRTCLGPDDMLTAILLDPPPFRGDS